ncbi:F-box/kelch-repeat protein At3g06240-like [Bidens hawaiensis]|uniref:F-box/kelch-repeat protein At3g06240-like n=1 Tax=Bidens hawaiensis TaxID=980011 RepID=UPI00404B6269
MAELAFDVLEEILIQLDVKDVIRCKSVCKSWQSLISGPRFVKAHLNHNIKSDRDNQRLGHRRIHAYVEVNWTYIVGSCNGLVCIYPKAGEFLVTNPSTRQQRILQTLPYMLKEKEDMISHIECWGFGYDSSSDDYKVVAGFRKDRHTITKQTTFFHVLTLKSNTWKVIGELEYQNMYVRKGILCDGVLYWFITKENYREKIIIYLDLSTEELKEIPQPDDADYNNGPFSTHRLGLVQDCLCIHSCPFRESYNIWVMKNNMWELYIDRQQSKYDVAHCLSRVGDSQNKGGKYDRHRLNMVQGDSQKRRGDVYGFIRHYDELHVPCNAWDYIRDAIFVKSLVSPHHHVDEEDNDGIESGNTAKRNRNRNRNRNRSKTSRKHKKASGCLHKFI